MEHCPYCGKNKISVHSSVIYGKGHDYGLMYTCEDYPKCDSYCGKGATLANRELRELRKKCHSQFDAIWKTGKKTRKYAYNWLSKELNLPRSQTHIALFDIEKCKKLLDLINK